jgi:hypothetical protein
MRINSRKIQKILGRIWTAPKHVFETFCTQEPLDASAWMQHSQLCFNSENQTKDFSYTMFPVRKTNVGKILKLWENCYLIILSIHILKLEISGCDRFRAARGSGETQNGERRLRGSQGDAHRRWRRREDAGFWRRAAVNGRRPAARVCTHEDIPAAWRWRRWPAGVLLSASKLLEATSSSGSALGQRTEQRPVRTPSFGGSSSGDAV